MADIYGRHFALQLSLIFFIAGSALSTGAKNMEMMLAGRGVAGVGAAGMLTVNMLTFIALPYIITYSILYLLGGPCHHGRFWLARR